ncbi:cell wall protein DAN4-like isoform X2 [Aricia agestis]|uniref:cell wall protein DAN4-like isoform X2 n=1 Tax=Aricia agestis TaxID=91739 RepID=UPI001C20AAB3|nr:cell wall protein DAN4-like isoform X2 [Aricia agestis]
MYLGVFSTWLLVCMKLGMCNRSDSGMEELIFVSNPIEAGLPGHWVPINVLKQALDNKNLKKIKHVIKPPKIIRKLPTNKVRTDKMKRTTPVFGAWQNELLTKRTTRKRLNKTGTFKKFPVTSILLKTLEDQNHNKHTSKTPKRTSTEEHETKIAGLLLQEPKKIISNTIHSRTNEESTKYLETTESIILKETRSETKPQQATKYTLQEITKSKTKLFEVTHPVTQATKITTENTTNMPEVHTQGKPSLLSNTFETSTSWPIGFKTSSMSRTKTSLKTSTLSMKTSSKPVTFTSTTSPTTAYLTTEPSKTTSTISKITLSKTSISPKLTTTATTSIPKTESTETYSATQNPPSTKVLKTTVKTTPTKKSTVQKPPMTTVTTTTKTTSISIETLPTPVSLSTTLSTTAKMTPTIHSTTLTPQTISTKPAASTTAETKSTSHLTAAFKAQTTLTSQIISTKPAASTTAKTKPTSHLTTSTPQTTPTTPNTTTAVKTTPSKPENTTPTPRPAIISTVHHKLKKTKSDPFY